MKVRLLLAAAGLALAAVTAHAADMTIYETPGFGGRSATLSGPMPDVRTLGFNARTASVVIHSGTWEVCSDIAFRGYCATLLPGQYPALDPRLNDRIASAREVSVVAEAAPPRYDAPRFEPPPYEPRASIELFGQRGFRGRSLQLERDAVDLSRSDFNDRAGSVVVNEGTWELCTGTAFRGTCRVFTPGRYAELGAGLSRAVSSARILRGPTAPQPVVQAPLPPVPPPVVTNMEPRVTLFDGDNFGGRSLIVTYDVADLRRSTFNDDALSILVEAGDWEVCTDPGFRGQCRLIGPGQYRRLEPPLYRSISSIRLAPPPVVDTRPVPLPEAAVELYEDVNFRGARFPAVRDVPDLDPRGFNDRASSMIIYEGQWEVCVDGSFRGRCTVFGPGRYPDLGGLRNEISSLRRVY